jgi:phosphatidylserine decarboxylase
VATLTAQVVAGRKLKAMDRNGFSDPYMVLQVGSASSSKNKARRRAQTKVIKKNLAPEWNERFAIDVDDLNEMLTISVFDKDLIGAGDLIGETMLPLATLVGSDGLATWHEIYNESEVTGEVLLGFSLPRPQGYESHEEKAHASAAAAAAAAAAQTAAAALIPSADAQRREEESQETCVMLRLRIRRIYDRYPSEVLQAAVRRVITPKMFLYW